MSKRTEIFLTVFLGFLTALAPLSTDMYLPALPELSSDLGISTSMTQLTLTMTMLGMAGGQVLGGPVSDRFGRKLPLFFGIAGFTLSAFVCAIVPDVYTFLVFRFIMGFSGAVGIVIARAIARDVKQGPALTQFMALLMMVNGLAPVAAPVLGGQILRFTTWRGIFDVLVVVGAAMFAATFLFRETLPKTKRAASLTASFGSFSDLMGSHYFLGHCLVQCFVFGSFFSYIAGSSFLFQNMYHVSPQTYSYIFGGIGIGLLVMGMIPARLAGTVREVVFLKYSLAIPFFTSLVFLAGLWFDMPMALSIPLLFITIVPLSVMGAASVSLALSRAGNAAGSASALLGFFSMILGGVMMPVVGIAGDETAIPMGVLMVAGYGLALAVFYKMIVPSHRGEL